MIQIAPWKIIMIALVCALGFAYAAPNVIPSETRANIPGWLPHKTVNLGLDLRGGAHLLYEVDIPFVMKERADIILQDVRSELRKERIGYSRIGVISGGVRVTLRDPEQAEEARRLIRQVDNTLLIDTPSETIITAVMSDDAKAELTTQAIGQSIEIVRRRVDELGTTEPSIARQGEDRILLQVPGADAEELKRIVGKTAKMSFHLVAQPGQRGLTLPQVDGQGGNITVERKAMITGDMLDNAAPTFSEGQAVVSFRLNGPGARRFCEVSRNNVNRAFAIVLDREVISAPVIREAICGGSGQISGNFTAQSANDLALLLRAGALPAPLSVMEERTVGPSLGADSIEAGRIASLIGLALVLAFMLMSYGQFGFYANIALTVNVALIFAVLSGMQATLTLPGIAGIVLTIGMAVDANVLIFERIREELRAGRTAVSAIDAGYSRAMGTIIDSNLTTLIAAIILFSFGTGPIKGFAVTLGVGIVTSFFSAIMVTRLFVVLWLQGARKKGKDIKVPV